MKSNGADDMETTAAEWAARMLSGRELSFREKDEHDRWLFENPEGAAFYREYLGVIDTVDVAKDALMVDKFVAELEAEKAPRTWLHAGAAMAATLVLAIAVSIFVVSPSPVAETYQTAIGERQEVTLADGSIATLNTNTQAAFDLSGDQRIVALSKGEALFNVVSDTQKPFIVATALADIVVTGTEFNVRTMPDLTSVAVLSGSVEVRSPTGSVVTLVPGQRVAVSADGSVSDIANYDAVVDLSWREGKARFNAVPLNVVVEELNRYFDRPLVIGDPVIAGVLVTGEFDLDDPSTATEALATAFSLESRHQATKVILVPRIN